MVAPTTHGHERGASHFKPEFLNRVDEIVVFHALDESHIERIVDIQVEML